MNQSSPTAPAAAAPAASAAAGGGAAGGAGAPWPQQQNFPPMMMYPGAMGGGMLSPPQLQSPPVMSGMYCPGMAGMPAAPPPGMFQGYLSYLDRQNEGGGGKGEQRFREFFVAKNIGKY